MATKNTTDKRIARNGYLIDNPDYVPPGMRASSSSSSTSSGENSYAKRIGLSERVEARSSPYPSPSPSYSSPVTRVVPTGRVYRDVPAQVVGFPGGGYGYIPPSQVMYQASGYYPQPQARAVLVARQPPAIFVGPNGYKPFYGGQGPFGLPMTTLYPPYY